MKSVSSLPSARLATLPSVCLKNLIDILTVVSSG
jgi:hypothetical protein